MAGKNQVTLTFAGDSDKLEKAFDRVASSADEMAAEVGQASGKVKADLGEAFDSAGESTDAIDTKAMGFRDTLTGVQDSMAGIGALAAGDLPGGLLLLGQGVGDLASGFTNLLIPAMKWLITGGLKTAAGWIAQTAAMVGHKVATFASVVATKAMTLAQRGLNMAMRANPIGVIITIVMLLVAAIIYLWRNNEGFRNFVIGAWEKIKNAFAAVSNWVKRNWPLIKEALMAPIRIAVDWIMRTWDKFKRANELLVRGIKTAFQKIKGYISAPFRAGVAAARSAWNSLVGGRGFTIPGWVPGLGGRSFRIPYFHQGGVVGGAPGTETLAMLQAGERVTPAGQVSRESRRTVAVDLGSEIMRMIRKAVRAEGGDVQIVLGTG